MPMPTQFTSTSARIIASIFVFAIIIGFVFTTRQGGSFFKADENVATVDSTPITYREFQMMLSQMAQRYSQLFGGKELSPQQLQQFGLYGSTIKQLIEKKMLFNLTENMGVITGSQEIRDYIKDVYFKDAPNGFNVEQYRLVLRSNNLTPQKFENMVKEDLQVKKIEEILFESPVSESFASEVTQFKSKVVNVDSVRVEKNKLQDFVKVSSKEIEDYLKDEKNIGVLKVMYDGKKNVYHKPEEVKAYHILYRDTSPASLKKLQELRKTLSATNFKSVANKETQDPSGKGKEGSLGWFSKGRMVPEFEKVAFELKKGEISQPVKTDFGYHIIYVEDKKAAQVTPFEAAKKELAEESIRKKKSKELDELMNQVAQNFEKSLKQGNAKKLASEYNLDLTEKFEVNAFDSKLSRYELNNEQTQQLFSATDGDIISFKTPSYIWLVKVNSKGTRKDLDALAKNQESQLSSKISRQYRSTLISKLTKNSNIDCIPDFNSVDVCKN